MFVIINQDEYFCGDTPAPQRVQFCWNQVCLLREGGRLRVSWYHIMITIAFMVIIAITSTILFVIMSLLISSTKALTLVGIEREWAVAKEELVQEVEQVLRGGLQLLAWGGLWWLRCWLWWQWLWWWWQLFGKWWWQLSGEWLWPPRLSMLTIPAE